MHASTARLQRPKALLQLKMLYATFPLKLDRVSAQRDGLGKRSSDGWTKALLLVRGGRNASSVCGFIAVSREPGNAALGSARGGGVSSSPRSPGCCAFPGLRKPSRWLSGGWVRRRKKKLMRKLGPRRGERGPWVRAAFGGGRKVAFFCFLASPERSHFGEGPTQQRLFSPYSCSFCPFFWGGGRVTRHALQQFLVKL